MTTQKRRVDRRVQRTRQVLQQAFIEVVREKRPATSIREIEKSFEAVSVQDITERANVNRGTFYLHFTDKYMLMDTVMREQFRQILMSALPPSPRWDRRTLHLLILAILHSFEGKYHHQHHPSLILAPLLERAAQEELTGLLLTWLKQEKQPEAQGHVQLETLARVVSWTIFGSAIQWSQEETTVSIETMADTILWVIMGEGGALSLIFL